MYIVSRIFDSSLPSKQWSNSAQNRFVVVAMLALLCLVAAVVALQSGVLNRFKGSQPAPLPSSSRLPPLSLTSSLSSTLTGQSSAPSGQAVDPQPSSLGFSSSSPEPSATSTEPSATSIPTAGGQSSAPLGQAVEPQPSTSSSSSSAGALEEGSDESSEFQEISRALLASLMDPSELEAVEGDISVLRRARDFFDLVQVESNLDEISSRINGNHSPAIARLDDPKEWLEFGLSSGKSVEIETETVMVSDYRVQFASCIGPRSAMEDTHVAHTVRMVGYPEMGLVGVFDGHAGKNVSEMLQKNIVSYFMQELESLRKSDEDAISDELLYARIILALNNSIVKIDEVCSKMGSWLRFGPGQKMFLHAQDGSTAIVAVFVKNQMIVANLGDSRAILVRQGVPPIPLSVDAKPTMPRYSSQVTELGGHIERDVVTPFPRLGGGIAVAAAVGDHGLIPLERSRKCVINKPEFTITTFEPGDILVGACDGLWDAVSSNKAAGIICERATGSMQDVVPGEVSDAALLTNLALRTPGQYDNVTAVVVTF